MVSFKNWYYWYHIHSIPTLCISGQQWLALSFLDLYHTHTHSLTCVCLHAWRLKTICGSPVSTMSFQEIKLRLSSLAVSIFIYWASSATCHIFTKNLFLWNLIMQPFEYDCPTNLASFMQRQWIILVAFCMISKHICVQWADWVCHCMGILKGRKCYSERNSGGICSMSILPNIGCIFSGPVLSWI